MQTRQGEGSTFTVTIPFEIASEKEGKGDSKEEKKESLKGIHLLLAEDNELNVEVARELLEERGAVVSTAADGQEAVRMFEESPEGHTM